jgi:hypothetical protein
MPLQLLWALSYMVWVNRLTTNPLAPARRRRTFLAAEPDLAAYIGT